LLGALATLKTGKIERPFELKVVVFLEAFVAVRYLIYAFASLQAVTSALNFVWISYIALMVISTLLAIGLWRFSKLAWIVAVTLSVVGMVSAIPLLASGAASLGMLWNYVPSIALDLLTVFILFRKSVKSLFWGARRGPDMPTAVAPSQNP